MLVRQHQFVETDGKGGRDRHADRDGAEDVRDGRDAGPPFAELQPAQVLACPPRHDQRNETEDEGERDRIAGVEQADARRSPLDLDGDGKRDEAQQGQDQRNPRAGLTA